MQTLIRSPGTVRPRRGLALAALWADSALLPHRFNPSLQAGVAVVGEGEGEGGAAGIRR